MTRLIISIFIISLLSCKENNINNSDKTSLVLVDNHLKRILDEIIDYKTNVFFDTDTNEISQIRILQKSFETLRETSKNPETSNQIKTEIEKLYEDYGDRFFWNPLRLTKDLDSLNFSNNGELKIALIELDLMTKISNKIKRRNLIYKNWTVLNIKSGVDEYKIYFTPVLDTINSDIRFGYFDTINHTLVSESDSNIIVKRIENYFHVKNKNPKTKSGYIKLKRPDGSFDNYPFEMK